MMDIFYKRYVINVTYEEPESNKNISEFINKIKEFDWDKELETSYQVTDLGLINYYLTHNYKKEKASTGSLFLDKDFDLINGSSNYLIYGHRNKNGLMFEDLMKYTKEDFYNEHTKVRFTTNKEDGIYEVLAVVYMIQV